MPILDMAIRAQIKLLKIHWKLVARLEFLQARHRHTRNRDQGSLTSASKQVIQLDCLVYLTSAMRNENMTSEVEYMYIIRV